MKITDWILLGIAGVNGAAACLFGSVGLLELSTEPVACFVLAAVSMMLSGMAFAQLLRD